MSNITYELFSLPYLLRFYKYDAKTILVNILMKTSKVPGKDLLAFVQYLGIVTFTEID